MKQIELTDGTAGGFKIFGMMLLIFAPFIFCVTTGLQIKTLIIGGLVVFTGFSFFLLDKWWEIRIDEAEKSTLKDDEPTTSPE